MHWLRLSPVCHQIKALNCYAPLFLSFITPNQRIEHFGTCLVRSAQASPCRTPVSNTQPNRSDPLSASLTYRRALGALLDAVNYWWTAGEPGLAGHDPHRVPSSTCPLAVKFYDATFPFGLPGCLLALHLLCAVQQMREHCGMQPPSACLSATCCLAACLPAVLPRCLSIN